MSAPEDFPRLNPELEAAAHELIGTHEDMTWIGVGDKPQAEVNAELNAMLQELGIDKARMIADLDPCYEFRARHVPTDFDSWIAGWFDALEWLRCDRS